MLARGVHHADRSQWFSEGSFPSPENCDNKCTDKQKTGFDWGDLGLGSFSNYGDFGFSGFSCQDKPGLGKRTGVGLLMAALCFLDSNEHVRGNAFLARFPSLAARRPRSAAARARVASPSPASASSLPSRPTSTSCMKCPTARSASTLLLAIPRAPTCPTPSVVAPSQSAGRFQTTAAWRAVAWAFPPSTSTALRASQGSRRQPPGHRSQRRLRLFLQWVSRRRCFPCPL